MHSAKPQRQSTDGLNNHHQLVNKLQEKDLSLEALPVPVGNRPVSRLLKQDVKSFGPLQYVNSAESK